MVEVPRNFLLLNELESGEKSAQGDNNISWGLMSHTDIELKTWSASIIGPARVKQQNLQKHNFILFYFIFLFIYFLFKDTL